MAHHSATSGGRWRAAKGTQRQAATTEGAPCAALAAREASAYIDRRVRRLSARRLSTRVSSLTKGR